MSCYKILDAYLFAVIAFAFYLLLIAIVFSASVINGTNQLMALPVVNSGSAPAPMLSAQ